MSALALVGVACLALPHAAAAQNIAEIIKQWGLLGTWAVDCSRPASGLNAYLRYVIRRPGQVSHERDFGGRSDVNEVREARRGSGGILELVVHFPKLGHARRYALIKGRDGRARAVANSRTDGTDVSIKDGKFTATGKPTPWQTRCRSASATGPHEARRRND
jgi:hypothetical protein